LIERDAPFYSSPIPDAALTGLAAFLDQRGLTRLGGRDPRVEFAR
jgi:hypothetical protein